MRYGMSHDGMKRQISSLLKRVIDRMHYDDSQDWGKNSDSLSVIEEPTLEPNDCLVPILKEKGRFGAEHASGIKSVPSINREGWEPALPSGKTRCRPDIGFITPVGKWAFEVKMSKSDLANSHTQCIDYMSCGYHPVVVSTRDLFANTESEDWPSFSKMMWCESGVAFGYTVGESRPPSDLLSLFKRVRDDVAAIENRDLHDQISNWDYVVDKLESGDVYNEKNLPKFGD